MTEQSNAELIAEARDYAGLDEYAGATLLREVTERLEAADQRAELAEANLSVEESKNAGYRAKNSQLAAVVEKSLAVVTDSDQGDSFLPLLVVLESAPADVLREHDAKVRAEERERYDPAKDERLARYMALVTPLGYASALEVVNSMTALLNVEARANEIAEQARREEREKAAQIAEEFDPVEAALAGRYAGKDIAARIREQGKEQGS